VNRPLFGAAVWGHFVALFKKKLSTISCYSHMVCSSCCRCVVLRIPLEKEKEKRLCGGVLIVKCHSACLQIVAHKANKYRKSVAHRFLFL